VDESFDLEDNDLEDRMSEIVDALGNIESAVDRVEQAIKEKSSVSWVFTLLGAAFIFWVISLAEDAWYSKWRYGLAYDVASDKVQIEKQPHDCDFLAVPIGTKYCRYDRIVSTLRWGTSTDGHPISSTDEGKTWYEFTPDANVQVPHYSTVEQVYVSWTKKEN